jgi:hypothetical protein
MLLVSGTEEVCQFFFPNRDAWQVGPAMHSCSRLFLFTTLCYIHGIRRFEMIRKPFSRQPLSEKQSGQEDSSEKHIRPWIWQRKIAPAFWTISGIFSMTINVILILVLILVGRQLFTIKNLIEQGLINGLYDNFVLMDEANIKTTIDISETIQVVDEIPVVFNLPLQQKTTVVLVEDTPIPNTTVVIDTGVISLNAPAEVTLPKGTPLLITLDLTVPVSQTVPVVLNVPVSLTVPVDIPLNQTELHIPFVGLQRVIHPYRETLSGLPDSWAETPPCSSWGNWLCRWLFDFK